MQRLRVVDLKEIAKSKGLRGYSRLCKAELINLLTQSTETGESVGESQAIFVEQPEHLSASLQDAPIPSNEIPKVPTKAKAKKGKTLQDSKTPLSPPAAPSDDEFKKIKLMKVPQLKNKAKEMGLQGYTFLRKKELLELIKNPIASQTRYSNSKRKVTMIEENGKKFTFPSIGQAAKFFNINPGTLGAKFYVKSEKARNSVLINGKVYKLEIE